MSSVTSEFHQCKALATETGILTKQAKALQNVTAAVQNTYNNYAIYLLYQSEKYLLKVKSVSKRYAYLKVKHLYYSFHFREIESGTSFIYHDPRPCSFRLTYGSDGIC